MSATLAREDILSVYAGQGLAPEEEEEILAQADGAMKFIPQYTTEDIERILKLVPRDEDGLMSFHDMQMAISKARAKHVKRLKAAMLALTKSKNKQAQTAPVEEKDRLAEQVNQEQGTQAQPSPKQISFSFFLFCEFTHVVDVDITRY